MVIRPHCYSLCKDDAHDSIITIVLQEYDNVILFVHAVQLW